jgi:hypothetical protein
MGKNQIDSVTAANLDSVGPSPFRELGDAFTFGKKKKGNIANFKGKGKPFGRDAKDAVINAPKHNIEKKIGKPLGKTFATPKSGRGR